MKQTFKLTKEEFIKRSMAGDRFKFDKSIYCYDKNEIVPFRVDGTALHTGWYKFDGINEFTLVEPELIYADDTSETINNFIEYGFIAPSFNGRIIGSVSDKYYIGYYVESYQALKYPQKIPTFWHKDTGNCYKGAGVSNSKYSLTKSNIAYEPEMESWAKFRCYSDNSGIWYEEYARSLEEFINHSRNKTKTHHHEIPNTRVDLPKVV